MKRKPTITTRRGVEVFRESVSARREFLADDEFAKMPHVWDALCEGSATWKTKTYRTESLDDYKRKVGITVLDDYVTLSADERLIENAKKGCKLSNFMLAHEIGHLILDHHATNAVTKNFQLFSGPNGMSNIPPTAEEYEANFAAVCFQCGVALLDKNLDAVQLANRAFCDVTWVRKVQRLVQQQVFQNALNRPRKRYERVVL